MNLPLPNDYIDIHNHGAKPCHGRFQVENLMTHENRAPDDEAALTYTIGIHPWYLTEDNFEQQINVVKQFADHQNIIALGETGFDRLKGPPAKLQQKAFEEQVCLADKVSKPIIIHCVRAWEELLSEHRKLKPSTKWIVHGFRGKKELARQLISRGMYLSFWFDFILRPESTPLLQSLPKEKIFLETDGSGVDIKTVYEKVALDFDISKEELKAIVYSNFNNVFK
jgi:TatD DNase family protein